MEGLTPEISHLLAAKDHRRRKLAGMPYPDKVAMVVQLQRMVVPILRARGRHVRVWNIQAVPTNTQSVP